MLKRLFTPSQQLHSYLYPADHTAVPETFSLLCWNVHKKSDTFHFQHYIHQLSAQSPIDFFLLQEAHFRHNVPFHIPHLTFHATANLEKRSTFYGVLTASACTPLENISILSKGKELIWGPRKGAILTKYSFHDGGFLYLLNLHGINFRENKHYFEEFTHIKQQIQTIKEPIVIAGDFNSWNHKRITFLHAQMEELGLKAVPFSEVKSFMKHHLDFIFYRGLNLCEYHIEKSHNLSDHHPLYAKFTKQRL